MAGFQFRDARSFYCRCGRRYLYEHLSGWGTDGAGNLSDAPTRTTIRDWYGSGPLTRCECGADLMEVAMAERPVR